MSVHGESRALPAAVTTVWASTDTTPADLGGKYVDVNGKEYRLFVVHDPNAVTYNQYMPVGFESGGTNGTEVTWDLTESNAALFSGAAQGSSDPGDNGYMFVQTRGPGNLRTSITSGTVLNAGDDMVWDADDTMDRVTSANNDVVAIYRGANVTGLTSTTANRACFILGRH